MNRSTDISDPAHKQRLDRAQDREERRIAHRVRALDADGWPIDRIAAELRVKPSRVRALVVKARARRSDVVHSGLPAFVSLGAIRRTLSVDRPIAYRTVRRWLEQAGIPQLHIGPKMRVYPKAAVEQWLISKLEHPGTVPTSSHERRKRRAGESLAQPTPEQRRQREIEAAARARQAKAQQAADARPRPEPALAALLAEAEPERAPERAAKPESPQASDVPRRGPNPDDAALSGSSDFHLL